MLRGMGMIREAVRRVKLMLGQCAYCSNTLHEGDTNRSCGSRECEEARLNLTLY